MSGSGGSSGEATAGGSSQANTSEPDTSENGGSAQGGTSASSQVASNGGSGQGGTSASSQVASSGGSAQGGTSTSSQVVSKGGSGQGGTSTSSTVCSSGAGGAYVVYDDFECGAGQWTAQPPSAFAIVLDGSNTFAVPSIINSLSYATVGNVIAGNYRVEAKVKVLSFYSGTGWSFVGLFGNFVSTSTYSAVTLWKDGKVAGSVRENGGGSDAADPTNVFVIGQWYTLALERSNGLIRLYQDGKLVSSLLDTNTPAGRVAIGAYNATARFDDVRVTLL